MRKAPGTRTPAHRLRGLALRRARAQDRVRALLGTAVPPDAAFLVRQAALADDARRAFARHRDEALSDLRNHFPEHAAQVTGRRSWRFAGGLSLVRHEAWATMCTCHRDLVEKCPDVPRHEAPPDRPDTFSAPCVYRVRLPDRMQAKLEDPA